MVSVGPSCILQKPKIKSSALCCVIIIKIYHTGQYIHRTEWQPLRIDHRMRNALRNFTKYVLDYTVRSKSLSIKWVMTVETNAVGLQHIWRIFK
jgi:hypothetical protein